MKNREHHLSVKVDSAELAQLHALASDRDETVSQMVRRWAREAHAYPLLEPASSTRVAA